MDDNQISPNIDLPASATLESRLDESDPVKAEEPKSKEVNVPLHFGDVNFVEKFNAETNLFPSSKSPLTPEPKPVQTEKSFPTLEEVTAERDSLYDEVLEADNRQYEFQQKFEAKEKEYQSIKEKLSANPEDPDLKNQLTAISTELDSMLGEAQSIQRELDSAERRLKESENKVKNYDEEAKENSRVRSSLGLYKTVGIGGVNTYVPYSPNFSIPALRGKQSTINQSGAEKIANGIFFQGLVGEVLGGTIEGFGALGIGPIFNNVGSSNMLTRMGSAMRADMQNVAPIHDELDPHRAFRFRDPGWWGKNIPNLLSTFSMLIPAAGTVRAISAIGRASKYGRLANRMRQGLGLAAKSEAQLAATGRVAEYAASTILMRHMENVREAADVAIRAETDFINSRMTPSDMRGTVAYSSFVKDNNRAPKDKFELAEYVGGRAASKAYTVNWWNLGFDAIQMAYVMKPLRALRVARGKAPKTRGAARSKQALDKAGKAATGIAAPDWLQRTGRFLKPPTEFILAAGSEGVEEMVNFVGAEEGMALAYSLRNQYTGTFNERLKEYMEDDHFYESAFWGALGGAGFQAIGLATSKKNTDELDSYMEQEQFFKQAAKQVKEAMEAGDVETANDIRRQVLARVARKAAARGAVDQLLEQIQSDEYLDQLAEMGLATKEELIAQQEEIIEEIKNEEAAVAEALSIGRKHGLDPYAVGLFLNRYADLELGIREQEKTIADLKASNKIPFPTGKRAIQARKELEKSLGIRLEAINGLLESDKLTPQQTAALEQQKQVITAIKEQLEFELLDAQTEAEEETEQTDTKKKEKPISEEELFAVQEELALEMYKQQKTKLTEKDALDEIQKESDELQKRRAENRFELNKKIIQNTTDTTVLEDIVKRLKKRNESKDKELIKLAKQRIKDIKAGKVKPPKPDGKENPKAVEEAKAVLAAIQAASGTIVTVDTLDRLIDDLNETKAARKLTDEEARQLKAYRDAKKKINNNQYINLITGKTYDRVSYVVKEGKPVPNNPFVNSALLFGSIADRVVRDFFEEKLNEEEAIKDLMNQNVPEAESRFRAFVDQLRELKAEFNATGETVYADNLLLHNDEMGVAGSADLITIDKAGNIRIYDMKTMKHSLEDVHGINSDNAGKNAFTTPYTSGELSKKEQYQRQLSLYRMLLANTYGIVAKDTEVLAVQLDYVVPKNGLPSGVNSITFLENVPLEPLDSFKALGKTYKLNPAKTEVEYKQEVRQILGELAEVESILRSSEITSEEKDDAQKQKDKLTKRLKDLIGGSSLTALSDVSSIMDEILFNSLSSFVPEFSLAQNDVLIDIESAVEQDLITREEAIQQMLYIMDELAQYLQVNDTFEKFAQNIMTVSNDRKVVIKPAALNSLEPIFNVNNSLYGLREDLTLQDVTNLINKNFDANTILGTAGLKKRQDRDSTFVPDGVSIVMPRLFNNIQKYLVTGEDPFGLGFLETQLKSGESLELDEQDAAIWDALLAIAEGDASNIEVKIVRDDSKYAAPKQASSVTVAKGASTGDLNLKFVTSIRTNTGTKFTYEVDPESEVNYKVVIVRAGEEIELGFLPKVNTLMKQAATLQLDYVTRKGDNKSELSIANAIGINTHTHTFDAILNIDRVIGMRQWLSTQGSEVSLGTADNVFKFQKLPNQQGNAKGNLLRPSAASTKKLADYIEIRTAVEENGFAVMLPDSDGNIALYNLKDGTIIQTPYQDGLLQDQDGIDYGIGKMFAPVNDPALGQIYVRLPKVTLEELGIANKVLELLMDDTMDTDVKANELRKYTVVTNIANASALRNKTRINSGIVYDSSTKSFLLIHNGADVLRLGDRPIGQKEIQDLQIIKEFPFSPSVVVDKEGSPIQQLDQKDEFLGGDPLQTLLLNSIQSPIAPVTVNDKIISFTRPGAPIRQPGNRYHPDTERTHMKVRLNIPEEVVKPDDKGKTDGKDDDTLPPPVFGPPAFLKIARLFNSPLNALATDVEMQEAENWLRENLPHIPFKRIKGLITRGGTTAYGIWEQGMITLSDAAVVGTAYHEALHAVMDTYLSPERKAKILAEARKKYELSPEKVNEVLSDTNEALENLGYPPITRKEAELIALEEEIAEAFREYMLTEGRSMKDKSAIARFFSELLYLIKGMFIGQYQTRRLMVHINKGKFKYRPDSRTQQFMTKFSKVPSFNSQEIKEIERSIPSMISPLLDIVVNYKRLLESSDNIEQSIDNAVSYLDKTFGGLESQSNIIRIVNNLNKINKDIDPDTGESIVSSINKDQIVKDLLELVFMDRGMIHSFLASVADETNQEVITANRKRVIDSKENLINYFKNRPAVRNRIMDSLKADAILGTTAAEQYGSQSMSMIDPKSKIPASIRNLIGSVPMLPTYGNDRVRRALKIADAVKRAESLKKALQAVRENKEYDKGNSFGLPVVMDFNEVYGYLIHHLNHETSVLGMMNKLEKLASKNPNLLMLWDKLNKADTILQHQFFASMKKADTAEFDVFDRLKNSRNQYDEISVRMVRQTGVKQAQSPENVLLTYVKDSMLNYLQELSTNEKKEILNKLNSESRIDIAEALQSLGIDTISVGALEMYISIASLSDIQKIRQGVRAAITAGENVINARTSKDKINYSRKFAAILKKQVLSKLVEIDFGAVALKFKNSEGVYQYSRMLPSFLTEEVDRLMSSQEFLESRVVEDPSLRSTGWVSVDESGDVSRSGVLKKNTAPLILRFGSLNGRAYMKLKPHQKLTFDLSALYHQVSDSEGNTESVPYISIPTPADAENSWVIKSELFGYATKDTLTARQKSLIEKMIEEELKNSETAIPGLEEAKDKVQAVLNHFQKEADLLMANSETRDPGEKWLRKYILDNELDLEFSNELLNQIFFELAATTFFSNRNYSYWISGKWSEYNYNTTGMQKRNKGPVSSGGTNAAATNDITRRETFRSVVMSEPKVNLSWVSEQVPGYSGKLTDRADGITYVTLDFYKRLLHRHGELTPAKEIAIDKALKGESLNAKDTIALITPYKPFYFGHKGEKLYMLKTAVMPLVPQFLLEGTGSIQSRKPVEQRAGLGRLLQYMDFHKLDQIHPPSVQKVGSNQPVQLFDQDNNFVEANFNKPVGNIVQELPIDHYRHQVHNPEHMDYGGTTGWMTQISKILHGNLHSLDSKINVNGRLMTGTKVSRELLRKEALLLQASADRLVRRFFETTTGETGRPEIVYDGGTAVIKDAAVRAFLLEHLDEVSNPAIVELLRSNRSLGNPMMQAPMVNTLFAILQKEHKNLRIPGGIQVQFSDLGVADLKGMRLSEDGKTVLPAQVITSRKFLPPELRRLSIEQIRQRDPKALEMLAYRIPGEHKNSTAVLEVVGFLEPGQDGMLVPADFIEQMGSDFDNDKLFLNWKFNEEELTNEQKIWNEYYDLATAVITNPEIWKSDVLQVQGGNELFKFRDDLREAGKLPGREIDGVDIDEYVRQNPYSYLSHWRMFADNIAGIGLKGISAQNNTFWLNLQRYQIEIDLEEVVTSPKGKEVSKISWKTLDRARLRFNSETVGAAMDGAKDPVYGELGIGLDNFQVWQDLYMVGFDKEVAWAAATDPESIAYLDNEYTKEEAEKKALENQNLAMVVAWNNDIRIKLEPVKKLMRLQEDKLKDLGTNFLPFLDPNSELTESIQGVRSIDSTADEVGDITDLKVIKELLDIAELTLTILESLQVPYFSDPISAREQITFEMSDRHQKYVAAKAFLAARRKGDQGRYVRMGELDPKANVSLIRPARKPQSYGTWNIKDFLDYFKTKAGQELKKNDPDLAFVLSNLLLRQDSGSLGKMGKAGNFYIELNHHSRLNDADMGNDFHDSWSSLLSHEKRVVKEFAYALAEYEAERSGWRFGPDTLTRFLPEAFIRDMSVAPQDALEIKLLAAQRPDIFEYVGSNKKNKAENSTIMVAITVEGKKQVYFTVDDLRGYIELSNDKRIFDPRSLSEMKKEFELNAVTVAESIESRSNTMEEESRLAQSTKKENNLAGRVAHLTEMFAASGIYVKVVLDSTITGAGGVKFEDGSGVIRIHPDKLMSDTIIHEFSHIYTELLGYNHPLVQQAIKELRTTQLYKDIQELYPDKSRRDLDMEVLATAMGKEGDQIYDEVVNSNKFQTILRKIFRAISNVLARLTGRKVDSITSETARLLAKRMLQGQEIVYMNAMSFQAEQRLKTVLSEIEMLTGVHAEITERIEHAKRLGLTEEEEVRLLNSLVQGNQALESIQENQRSKIVPELTKIGNQIIAEADLLLNQSKGYLELSKFGRDWTAADQQFFNRSYNIHQMLMTMNQAITAFDPLAESGRSLASSKDILKFKQLNETISNQITRLGNTMKEAISNNLKRNSDNPIVRDLTMNIFDMALSSEESIWKYAMDSNIGRGYAMGLKEQRAVTLKLYDKIFRRVLNTSELEARKDISEINKALDSLEEAGFNIESLLDESGKAFINPIKYQYYKDRAKAEDPLVFDALNKIQEYTQEYLLEYKLRKRTEEVRAAEDELRAINEREKRLGSLSEEDELRRTTLTDTINAADDPKLWKKYHTWKINRAEYVRDRLAAKNESEEALSRFDAEFSQVANSGKRVIRPFTKYKEAVVRDQYVNKEYVEDGGIQVIEKYRNPEFNTLTAVQRDTIDKLKSIMRGALGRDHTFFERSLIPQLADADVTVSTLLPDLKKRITNYVTITGKDVKERMDAQDRPIYVRSAPGMLFSKSNQTVSKDIRRTISEFLIRAHAERAKDSIETFSLATRDQVDLMQLVTSKKRQYSVVGIGKNKVKSKQRLSGAQSRAAVALENYLKGYFGSGWLDEGRLDQLIQKLMMYNSIMGIGLNPRAWIKNVNYGSIQQRIEAFGGVHYNRKQANRARRLIAANSLELFKLRNKSWRSDNKTIGLIQFFDVTMDQKELSFTMDRYSQLIDFIFIGQNGGEMIMQNQVLLAMLMGQEVTLKDGETTNLFDLLNYNSKDGVQIPEGATMKVGGQTVNVTLEELATFKEKVRSYLQRVHGAYNREDLGVIGRTSVGNAVLQFRKWVPHGVAKRYGAEEFSEARGQWEIGWYTGALKFINAYIGASKEKGKFAKLSEVYASFDESPHIQLAMKKAALEVAVAGAASALTAILASLIEIDPDDDDEFFLVNDEFYKAFLLYQTEALRNELHQFINPAMMLDFVKKFGTAPVPASRSVEYMAFALGETLDAAITGEWDRYEGGYRYGQIKALSYFKRSVPIWKHVSALQESIASHHAFSIMSR